MRGKGNVVTCTDDGDGGALTYSLLRPKEDNKRKEEEREIGKKRRMVFASDVVATAAREGNSASSSRRPLPQSLAPPRTRKVRNLWRAWSATLPLLRRRRRTNFNSIYQEAAQGIGVGGGGVSSRITIKSIMGAREGTDRRRKRKGSSNFE